MTFRNASFVFVLALILLVSGGNAFAYFDPVTGKNISEKTGEPVEKQPEPSGEAEQQETVYKPYYGPKKRIAVSKFENKVTGVYGNWNLGDGFAEMLTTELMKSGRFVVVERQALQDILGEQELGMSGLVRKETAAKVGQVLGAQIIVRGVVSEFDMKTSGGGGGVSFSGIRVGLNTSNAHVAVDIRLIDADTGQVLYSHNAAGTANATGIGLGVVGSDVSFDGDAFKKTPLGQATRQAIGSAMQFIIDKMETMPFQAKVVKFSDGKVYMNVGSSLNIKPGDRFLVYSKGEELIDPDTGLNLGSEDKLIGTVEVVDVQDKYSIGQLVSGSGMLKRGDVLKME